MEKIQYIRPEMRVCELGVQQNMLSGSDVKTGGNTPANGDDALANENSFTDIWGNEY